MRDEELLMRLSKALDVLEELVMTPPTYADGVIAYQYVHEAPAAELLVAEGRLRRVPHEVYVMYERVPAAERKGGEE